MNSLSSNVLSYHLNRIYKFLISDEETIRFRFVTPVEEKILVRIATDTAVLKNEHIDDNCKSIATQIATVLEQNIHNFTLKYMFDKNESKEMEMVYQKMPVAKELKPLRKPNTIKGSLTDDEPFIKGSVMSSFKARWLNATLKFLKSDQLVLQYPNMTAEQAEFVREMISQCMTREGLDIGFGFKGLYAPLADALRTVGAKYHLKLSRLSPDSDMQCWKFEKQPISRKKAKDDITSTGPSKSTADQTGSKSARKVIITDQTGSENAQFETTDLTGSEFARKAIITDLTGSENANQPKSVDRRGHAQIIETIDLTDDSYTMNDTQPAIGDTPKVDLTWNQKKIRHIIEICKSLSGTFKKTALMQLRDFIADDNKDQLVFSALRMQEMIFLMHWKVVISRVEIIGMFGVEGQMTMDQIRHSVHVNVHRFSVKVSMDNMRKEDTEKLNDVIFRKDFVADRKDKEPKRDTNVFPTSSLIITRKDVCFLKHVEKVEPDFIEHCLRQLIEFLSDDAHASLVFPRPPFEKEAFLNSILGLKEPLAVQIFNSSMLGMWNNIQSLLEKNSQKYTVKKVRPAGMNARDFTFRKEPYFGTTTFNSPDSSKTKQTNSSGICDPKESRTDSLTRKMDTLRALYRKSEPNTDLPIPQHTNNPNNTKNDTRNIESSIRVIPPAGKTNVHVTSFPDHTRVVTLEDKRAKPSSAKAQIIKALQQPVVSEKGSKMMRLMGWEGGALGARGDGIVEPIMPELDTAHRAGLGLFKPKKMTVQLTTELPSPVTRVDLPRTPGKKEFKLGILQTVLMMLTTEDSVYEVNFPEALTEKKWAFIRRSVTMFNLKGKLFAEENKLKKITRDIMNVMKETDYIITASFAKTKRKIQFVKCKGVYVPKTNEWADVVNLDHLKKHSLPPKDFSQQGDKGAFSDSDGSVTKDNASANKTTNNDDNSNNVAQSKSDDAIVNNTTKITHVEDVWYSSNINTKGATNVEVEKKTAKYDGIVAKNNFCMTKDAECNIGKTKDAESNIGNAKDAESNIGKTKDAESNIGNAKDAESNIGKTKNAESNIGNTKDVKSNIGNTKDVKSNIGNAKDVESNANIAAKETSNNLNDIQLCIKEIEKKTNTTKDSETKDCMRADHEMVYTDKLIVTPTMDFIDSLWNLEDVLSDLNVFKRYIMKEILKFCKEPIPIDSNVQGKKGKILKVIYLKGEMNETHIICVKDMITSFKELSQNDLHTGDRSMFDEIVSLIKGYFLAAHIPPEKVVPTERTGIRIYKRIVLEKILISNKSKTYLCKLNLKPAKNVSNNPDEMQSANSANATPILSDNEINKLKSTKGNAQDIERQTNIISNISAIDKEISKNIESVNNKLMTFTNDVIDEKCMFDYVQDKIEDVDAIMKNDNTPEHNNNENEHKIKDVNTTFTSDKFDEKCMFDYVQDKIEDVDAIMKNDNTPEHNNNENEHKIKDVNTTFTSDKFDEKCMFDYVQDKIEDVDAIMKNDNTPEHNNNENEHKNKDVNTTFTSDKFDETCMFDYVQPLGSTKYSTSDKGIDEKIFVQDSHVQILKDKDSVQITDKQEKYMVLEQQTVDVIEIEKSGVQIQTDVVKNVDVDNLNMLKRLRSDDLLSNFNTEDKDCLLSKSDSLTAKDEKIKNVTDIDKFGKRSLTQTPERQIKKCKYAEYNKEIAVVPDNYPQTEIDKKMAGIIQKSILASIDYKQELPLLRCLGIQNGALTYCCRTEESYNSLERLIRSLGGLQITEKTETVKTRHIMAFRITTFLEERIGDIFERFESYNPGLSTKYWSVLKKEEGGDYIVIQVELDDVSYKYILDAKFLLHAGIDEAVFSMVW